jgi:hypothetical protein
VAEVALIARIPKRAVAGMARLAPARYFSITWCNATTSVCFDDEGRHECSVIALVCFHCRRRRSVLMDNHAYLLTTPTKPVARPSAAFCIQPALGPDGAAGGLSVRSMRALAPRPLVEIQKPATASALSGLVPQFGETRTGAFMTARRSGRSRQRSNCPDDLSFLRVSSAPRFRLSVGADGGQVCRPVSPPRNAAVRCPARGWCTGSRVGPRWPSAAGRRPQVAHRRPDQQARYRWPVAVSTAEVISTSVSPGRRP